MPGHKRDQRLKRLRGYQLDSETGKALAPEPKKVKGGESPLTTRLLALCTEGRLSATCVQELAHLAMLEPSNPELQLLGGNYREEDIPTNFLKGLGICAPNKIRVKCLDRTNSTIEEDMFLLLPHMLFSSLANNYVEDLFPGEGLETFWEQTLATREDRLVDHP